MLLCVAISQAEFVSKNQTNYQVAHKKKHPKLCNDVVLLNSKIQTKRNNTFEEQS